MILKRIIVGERSDRVGAVVRLFRAYLVGACWTIEVPHVVACMPERKDVGGLRGDEIFLVDHSEMIGNRCRYCVCVFLISNSGLSEGVDSKASLMASFHEIKGCEVSDSSS